MIPCYDPTPPQTDADYAWDAMCYAAAEVAEAIAARVAARCPVTPPSLAEAIAETMPAALFGPARRQAEALALYRYERWGSDDGVRRDQRHTWLSAPSAYTDSAGRVWRRIAVTRERYATAIAARRELNNLEWEPFEE